MKSFNLDYCLGILLWKQHDVFIHSFLAANNCSPHSLPRALNMLPHSTVPSAVVLSFILLMQSYCCQMGVL